MALEKNFAILQENADASREILSTIDHSMGGGRTKLNNMAAYTNGSKTRKALETTVDIAKGVASGDSPVGFVSEGGFYLF